MLLSDTTEAKSYQPESYEGTQALYNGITFEKDKNFNDEWRGGKSSEATATSEGVGLTASKSSNKMILK